MVDESRALPPSAGGCLGCGACDDCTRREPEPRRVSGDVLPPGAYEQEQHRRTFRDGGDPRRHFTWGPAHDQAARHAEQTSGYSAEDLREAYNASRTRIEQDFYSGVNGKTYRPDIRTIEDVKDPALRRALLEEYHREDG